MAAHFSQTLNNLLALANDFDLGDNPAQDEFYNELGEHFYHVCLTASYAILSTVKMIVWDAWLSFESEKHII